MASAFAAGSSELQLHLVYQDVYGQKSARRIPLGPSTADPDVLAIVDDIDLISNAQILSAKITNERVITGMKAAPINALERKVSDLIELTFIGTNTSGKLVQRSIGVPAPLATTVLLDGTIDTSNVNINALIAKLMANLAYVGPTNLVVAGTLLYSGIESHQISIADIVDKK